ncbi:MAG: hypothetical protein KIT84_07525 [Labilithrix sp.]|nr:hypothetical protein [Labilithrix sp.]MCW5810845.1 hypothetical protein [Labilithrix sp.]
MLIVLAALAAGCGSVGDVEERDPLASVDGQLTVADLASPPASLRVAVVWTDGKRYVMAEDVPVEPVFPARFQVRLVDPPPRAAMGPGKDGSEVALGALVAYEDKNGNGRLDLVDEGAPSFVDRVLGANPDVLLAWFEGLPASADGPRNGYQFMKVLACEKDADCIEYLPITTPYAMALTDEPELARVMCTNGGGATSSSSSLDPEERVGPGPGGAWPATDDPKLTCSEDRKSYTYEECGETEYLGLCGGTQQGCAVTTWTYPGGTAPVGWPCP